jgi:hypothetical protein
MTYLKMRPSNRARTKCTGLGLNEWRGDVQTIRAENSADGAQLDLKVAWAEGGHLGLDEWRGDVQTIRAENSADGAQLDLKVAWAEGGNHCCSTLAL